MENFIFCAPGHLFRFIVRNQLKQSKFEIMDKRNINHKAINHRIEAIIALYTKRYFSLQNVHEIDS